MDKFTKEEKNLLSKLSKGNLDGIVGKFFTPDGSKISFWKTIIDGIPQERKQGPTTKFFDGNENIKKVGNVVILREYITDEDKLSFLQKFGWLINDDDVKAYSSKFKSN